MRSLFGLTFVCLIAASTSAQQPKRPQIRFEVNPDISNYPQETPKNTLDSVLRAINRDRIDYLVAQLLDPAYVDDAIAATRATPAQFIKMVQANLSEDPDLLRDLKRIVAEGEIQEGGETATVKHKDIKDKSIFLRKVDDRWFMQNRRHEEKKGKE